MNVAAKNPNPKWHSAAPHLGGEMSEDSPTVAHTAGNIRSSVDGEMHDTPGSHAYTNVSQEYSAQRHEAYDSQFAQPAYSGHGKVEVGKTSAL
jgi:hypothetical protein